jgi:hypothetical protein
MDLAFGHYRKAIDASTGMFRDAATRIKAIKPTAKVMSVEALPWWTGLRSIPAEQSSTR